jgi:peptidoglycan-N-acetylglucosamine deacetylase
MGQKRIADLSLDLDNKWSYMKTHGDAAWEQFPTYLPTVIPLVLDILDRLNLKITVFVVGQDAVLEDNQASLRALSSRGHEIGNHSFHHEPWLQRYSRDRLEEEFRMAEQAIASITDQKLVGFRGPGYSLSRDVLEILVKRGYRYDGSTLPTFLGPLARAYYFFKSNLSRDQAEDRKQLFGSVWDGLRSIRPYHWDTPAGKILEIPVTTMPIFRAPFHISYLLYLAQYSETLASLYFRWSLALCSLFGLGPSLLLHPLDFLGGDEVEELSFFPAMNLPGHKKRAFVSRMLKIYSETFDVRPMGQRAEAESELTRGKLKVRPASEMSPSIDAGSIA